MARTIDRVAQAREAALQGDWPAACSLLEDVDAGSLAAEDVQLKADALWWVARVAEAIDVRQQAYAAFVAEGEPRRAAWTAWFLYGDYWMKGDLAVASGWLMRAKRHLAGEPESVEHGLVALSEAGNAHGRGEIDTAVEMAAQTLELARRLDSTDLTASALDALGRFTIDAGRVKDGLDLLDEAMALVVAGLTGPMTTGAIFCNLLQTCFRIADFGRAVSWTEAARRWYESMPGISPFHGLCRIHRVEVAVMRGEWDVAEAEARRAGEELAVVSDFHAAGAVYILAEILRRRGELAAAEDEFARAHRMGREPQPGLALVRLAQGDIAAASAGLRVSLDDGSANPLGRAALLAAQVEVALAGNDGEAAAAACSELDRLADGFASPLLKATAATACAARCLAGGELSDALTEAHAAVRLLGELRMPHETALARLLLAMACRQAGDEERARLEIEAARVELERLGARLDARRAATLLDEPSERTGLSDRELEVLRLVAAGKTNREIAADLVLSEHTISRHLQNIFRKIGVSSRAAATAYAFEHGMVGTPPVV